MDKSSSSTRHRKNSRHENGQSMIELALTFVFLMVLLAGTIDLGRAFFTWQMLRDAAQEGASYATVYPPIGGNVDHIISRVICSSNPDCESNPEDNPNTDLWQLFSDGHIDIQVDLIGQPCLGSTVIVTVVYTDFPLTMPFLGTILNSQTIPIRATINDTVLRPRCP